MRSRRIAPGLYETPEGHLIERVPQERRYGYGAFAWFVTWPGQSKPDAVFETKADALEALS